MPRRKLKGKGKFKEFLGKANNFLKKSQILSKLGNMYSKVGQVLPLPYAGTVGTAANVAGKMGYGRKKRHVRKGGSLRPSGGSVRRGRGLYTAGGGSRHMISSRRPNIY